MTISCSKKNSFEESKKIYFENKENFSEVINLFESIKEINSLRRYESSFPDNIFTDKAHWLNYTLEVISDRRGFIIFIDNSYKTKEPLYWGREFSEVKTNSELNLQDILDSNNISKEAFIKFKDFLSKNEFYLISKVLETNYLIIMINQTSGFLYNPNEGIPKYIEANIIQKIDEHVFYFNQTR